MIQELTKEFEKLKESSKKEIGNLKRNDDLQKKIELLDNNSKELNDKIKLLNKKLNLLFIIIILALQRDTYKKTLEILLEHVISKYELKISNSEGEPLWKYTKQVSEKILELNDKKEDENNKKLVKSLISLLFCKDYEN